MQHRMGFIFEKQIKIGEIMTRSHERELITIQSQKFIKLTYSS